MKIKLGDICEIFDGPHATPPEAEHGPIFLGIKNITESNELDLSNAKRLSEDDYKVWTKRVTPQKDDIVFSYEATLNRYALIPEGFYGCLGRRLAIVRVKDISFVDPHYLYYYFCSPAWNDFILKNKVIGSTVLRVSIEEVPNYMVEIPDISTQHLIAGFLDKIRLQIENNKAICAELEAMAKLLYDYWFVQFDFPDENGRPYKSSGGKMVWNEELKREIPEGWEVKPLKGLYRINRGLSYTSKDIESGIGVPMLNLACIDTKRNYRDGELKYHNGKIPDDAFVNAGDLMIACTDLTRDRAIIGCPILVPDDGVRYTYSMDMARISFPTLLLNEMYMYMTLRTEFYHNYIKAWASGTTVLHLNLEGLDWYNICVPPIELQEKFGNMVKSIHSQKSEILCENRELASLRDFLLPMLMNGQVSFKEVC